MGKYPGYRVIGFAHTFRQRWLHPVPNLCNIYANRISPMDATVHEFELIELEYNLYKAIKSSPLLGPFCGSEFWGFSLLKI